MSTKRTKKDKSYRVTLKLVLYRSYQIDATSKKEAIEAVKTYAGGYLQNNSDQVARVWADEQEGKKNGTND